jgi:hypothetical protein
VARVNDGEVAEKLIHAEMQDRGFRINDRREFFSISLHRAIEIISQIVHQLSLVTPPEHEKPLIGPDLGEYYLTQGLNALNGTENVLQDFKVALESFERAILYGSKLAYFFKAHLFIAGRGVKQSADTAVKTLLDGGRRGSPECYQTLWSIYAGNTLLNAAHHENSEVVYGWLLALDPHFVETRWLIDYIDYSSRMRRGKYFEEGDEKYLLSEFGGKYFSSTIDLIAQRLTVLSSTLNDVKTGRIDIDTLERLPTPSTDAIDMITFLDFLKKQVIDGESLRHTIVNDLTDSDIRNYGFRMSSKL